MDYKKLQIAIFPKLTNTDDGQKIKISEIKVVSFLKNLQLLPCSFHMI